MNENESRAREIVAGLVKMIEAHDENPETTPAPDALAVEPLVGMRITLELGGPTTWLTLVGGADGTGIGGELTTYDPETGSETVVKIGEADAGAIWDAFDPGVA